MINNARWEIGKLMQRDCGDFVSDLFCTFCSPIFKLREDPPVLVTDVTNGQRQTALVPHKPGEPMCLVKLIKCNVSALSDKQRV